MPRKYYVVWEGRERGVYTEWNECRAQVDGHPGARYKSYPTLDEAQAAFRAGPAAAPRAGAAGGKPAATARRAAAAAAMERARQLRARS